MGMEYLLLLYAITFALYSHTRVDAKMLCSKQTEYQHEFQMRSCMASCLDLIEAPDVKKQPCYYNGTTGKSQGCGKVSDLSFKKVVMCETRPATSYGLSDELARWCDMVHYNVVQFNTTSDVVWAKENASSIMAHANNLRKVGVKVIGTFELWETCSNFMRISASAKLREKMAASILEVVEQLQLDGLYLMWHWPGCPMADKCKEANPHKNYTIELISAISKPLKSTGRLFLMRVTFNPWLAFMIDDYYSPIMPYVDYFVLETNNLHGHWSIKPDFNFNLKATREQVKNFVTKVKHPGFAKKIVATFVLEVLSLELVTSTKDNKLHSVKINSNGIKYPRFLKLYEWCKLIRPGSGYAVFNNTETQNYAVKEDHLFVFDNVQSLKEKMEWLNAIGVAGVNFLATDADDLQNVCGCGRMPFVRTVAQLLKSNDCDPRQCF